jgi:hypothetical protein
MLNTLEPYQQHLKRILPIPTAWHMHTQGFETRVLMRSPLLSGQCQVAIFDTDCPYYCFGFVPCSSKHQGLSRLQSPAPLLEHKVITSDLWTQTVFVHKGFDKPHFILCRDIQDDKRTIELVHLNLTKSEAGYLPGLPESGSAFTLDIRDFKRDNNFSLQRAEGPRRYSVWNKAPISFQYA